MSDIVTRLLQCVAARINAPETFSEAMAREIEEEIRLEFGGDVLYVARCDRERRNRRIRRDYAHNESLDFLERRYRLSRKQLLRILADCVD